MVGCPRQGRRSARLRARQGGLAASLAFWAASPPASGFRGRLPQPRRVFTLAGPRARRAGPVGLWSGFADRFWREYAESGAITYTNLSSPGSRRKGVSPATGGVLDHRRALSRLALSSLSGSRLKTETCTLSPKPTRAWMIAMSIALSTAIVAGIEPTLARYAYSRGIYPGRPIRMLAADSPALALSRRLSSTRARCG